MGISKKVAQKLKQLFRAHRRGPQREESRRVKPPFYRPRIELLEDRTLLSVSGTDLKTYIQNLLTTEPNSFSQTETISSASIGGFLQINNLTLTENGTLSSAGVWSGTVGLSATSATLFPGDSFSAAISNTVANQPALTGTFTIGTTSGPDFSLSVPTTAKMVINVGEALNISASNISFTYNSTGPDTQTLATIQTATVTSTQFTGMPSATLSNFALREDGFSFSAFNLNSTSASQGIGGFLSTTGVALTVSNFNVSFGTTENPTPSVSGTVGITLSGLQLFPTGNFVQLQTTGVTASYNFGNFNGTGSTGQLSVTISGFQLTMGEALQISAVSSNVVITPDQQTLATIGTVTLSSPEFSGLGTLTASNLQIQQTGFSLGTLAWSSPGAVTVAAGVLSFQSATVNLSNFALSYGATPSVSGSISFNVSGAQLFPTIPLLNISLGTIAGSFDFGNATAPGLMNLQISNLNISLGDALTINLGSVDLTPGLATMFSANNVSVTANLFSGLPAFTMPTFTLLQSGFSLGSFSIPLTSGITIGNFIALSNVSIGVNNFTINTSANPVISGSITATLGTMTLFPGNSAVTSSFTNVVGSYNFASATNPGQFSLSIGSFSLSLFSQISLTASNVTVTPGQSTLATIGSATLTFAPLNSLAISIQNLAIMQNGFTIASASVNLPSNLTLGSLLTLNTPTVTLTSIAYTLGGTLTGTVGFSASGASLELGSALDISVGQSTGSYNLSTEALSMTLDNLSVNLAGFANLSAAVVSLSYVPATDGSSTMTVGATGVEAFMGTGTGSSRVGVDLTGGTLALEVLDSTSQQVTYALNVTGSVNLLGMPANTISVTSGNVQFLEDTAGAVSTSVMVGSTSVPLSFTANETEALATGLNISVGGFASITGDFGFQEFTANSNNYLAIGAQNVAATVSAGGVSVAVTGASLGLLIDTSSAQTTYALVAGGGTDSLNGVPGLTVTGTGLTVRVRHGLDPSTVSSQLPSGVITPDGTVPLNFSNLGTGTSNVTDVEGNITLAIANFVSMTGSFGFQQFADNGTNYLAVGATGLTITLGTGTTNLTVSNASFGLIIAPGSGSAPATYALEATAGSANLNGVPDLSLTGSNLLVLVRSGLNVSGDPNIPSTVQTPGGVVTLNFSSLGSGTTNVTSIEGDVSLSVANFGTLTGDFGFQTYVDPSGAQQIAVGATNLTAVIGTSTVNLTLSNATVGLVIEPSTTGGSATYALEETGGSASLNGITGLTLSANNLLVEAREGLDLSAVSGLPVIQTAGGNVTLNFSAMGPGTGNVLLAQGVVTLSVANFVTVTGAFGLQVNTIGQNTYLAAGMDGGVTLSAGPVSLALTNLTIGVLVDDNNGTSTYALQANEGNGSTTTLTGPAGLSLSATNLAVLVDKGLNLSTYPSGVPTSIAVPAITQSATETFTPNWSTTTSITLQHTASAGTLVVTSTPSGGSPTTLVAGTDYSLGTNPAGDTTITFINVPASGATVQAAYTYVRQAAATIALNFSGLPAGSTNITDIQGNVNLNVAGFVSLSGSFGFQEYTPTSGDPILVVGATNVNAMLGTPGANVSFTGASFGMLVQDGNYALTANGGTVALNGIPDLSFAASNLEVKVESGLNPANVSGAPTSVMTPGGNVALNFGGLSGTNVTQIEGTATVNVAGFVTLSGTYSFTESTTPDQDGMGTTTKILVGASNVSAFIGTPDGSVGVQITGASMGLVIYSDTEATASTYALQASAPSISVVGLPTGISLTGSATVAINKTGAAVNETIPGSTQTVSFANGTNIESFGGSLMLSIAGAFSLSGNFSFTEIVNGTMSKLLIGATNITAPSITADGNAGSFSVSNGTLGMVIYTDNSTTPGTNLGYILSASATATALAGNSSATVTLTILRNTTTSAQTETVTVGTAQIPLNFSAQQVEMSGSAYQTIVVSNADLDIDNGLIIKATSGTSTTPVTGATSEVLTGVTLTVQDPSNPSDVLFTINAGSADYTTFSGTVTASNATSNGLTARHDGQSWASGNVDLVLTNVSFTIGSFVSFSANTIELQHYMTPSNGTVDYFSFNTASLGLLNNGQPMVSLTGSPAFDYVTGAQNQANNGFMLDPNSTPFTGFKFLDPTTTLGPITLVNPSIGLSNFSFALTGELSATVTVSAATATIGSSPLQATFTGLAGSFTLGLTFNLGDLSQFPTVSANGFMITATAISIKLGPYVTLSATGTMAHPLAINPTAGPTQNLISFATLGATLNIPGTPVNLTGTASDFAIEGNGTFLAQTGFGVSISLGASSASNLSWPSWLPLQSASASLVWANFNADPNDFLIEMSATINTTIAGMTVSGNVTNAVIDPTLIADGQFGIVSLGGLAVGVSGNLFGGSVSGELIGGVVRFDANGAIVDGLGNLVGPMGQTTTTPGVAPFQSAFYAGIEGSFNLASMGGFNIRVGLSQFGPLQIYVEADVPIPLGNTGLFISSLRGGITFGTSFPPITLSNPEQPSDALQLGGAAFSTPDSLTAAQWQAQLQAQVANQIHSGQTGAFSFPASGDFIIQAGLTIYAFNPNVFQVSGDVFFDTTGNFLVIGTATIGNSFSVGVKVYANLAPLFQGQQSLNILFLMQVPAQPNPTNTPPIYQIYGFINFSDTGGVFQITIGGEADVNVLGGLKAEVTATLQLTFTSDSFNLTLSNGDLTIPTIQATPIGTCDASLTIENSGGNVQIWGGFLLTVNLTALNSLGIYTSAQVFIKLNTTDVEQTVVLSNGTLSLDPESFALFINGVADFQIGGQVVFSLSGTLTIEINATSLTIFVQAQLLLGPDPNNPIMTFNANGLIFVELVEDDSDPNNIIYPGFAAKIALTLGANVPNGITFGANFLLVMNTTESTVTFDIPAPVATNPPSPPIPTVLGPDYSSGDPLALTSYETITNGVRTLVIPDGAPATGLSNYANWTPASPDVYLIVLGRGSLTIANAFTLSGGFNIEAEVGSSSVSFTLDVNADLNVNLNGNTVFSFQVAGGIQISNAGVAAALDLTLATGAPSSLGFSLNASFMLELNTTSNTVSLAGLTLPANQVMIAAAGNLMFLGGVVDLQGSFDITISSTSLTVAVAANVTFLGATFTANGFAGIYYDSNPGLALNIALGLPGGAQGIAPIAALGSNFVISGAFDLQLNTCSVTRNGIAPGFQVSVNNLGVYLYGFNLTGSVSVSITNAGFGFSANLNLNVFGFANLGISGYYDPNGNFSFTGTAGFSFGNHIFGLGGSISITISNSGFAFSISGWAAAFGIQISAFGAIAITGSSVDVSIGFSVTLVPAINIDTNAIVVAGITIFPAIHIHTPAVVISETAHFHLGSVSPPPVVAQASPPPPTPPPLAGVVSDPNHNNASALELYLGQDVGNRVNGAGQLTGAQSAENYTLARVSGDPGSSNGETISVSALGLQQTYHNVQEVLVHNTQAGNDTINVGSSVQVPVYMTLGSGNNTINSGSGPATVNVSGGGSNQITTGNNSTVTISAAGSGANQVAAGAGANVNVTGNGSNKVTLSNGGASAESVTINGTGANAITETDGAPTITVAGSASGNNSVQVNTASASIFNIYGGGSNSLSSIGSGPATFSVDGNGANQISTGGAATNVYLVGAGNNQVSTGTGSVNVYDRGTGGNTVSGGSGGGTDFYGVDGNGNAYASKGASSISTAYGNFSAYVSGYSTYQLSDYGLAAGNYNLGLTGVQNVTLNAASASAANSFTLANWSGNATLNGAGSNNTFTMIPGPAVGGINDVLSNSSLQVTGGLTQTIGLNDIQTANLTGSSNGDNSFDVSAWTGTGSLTGGVDVNNTLIATDDVANFFLSDSLLQRTGFGDMTLSGIQVADLSGGAGNNTFTVSNWSGSAALDGMAGSNTFNITLTGSGTGTISVANTGSTGTNTLNVTADRTTFVNATSVRVGTQQVNYAASDITVLNVYGGASGLTFDVQSTNATVTTTVQTTGTANVINVGSAAGVLPFVAGVLSKILGALSLLGGGQDTANVDDSGDTLAMTGTLSATAITGLGMGSSGISYSGIKTLNIKLGSGGNGFYIVSTAAATTTNVYGALSSMTGGNDTFYVASNAAVGVTPGSGSLDNILGPVNIDAGSGSANRLILDNSQGVVNTDAVLTSTSITGLAPAAITYAAAGAFTDGSNNDGILICGSLAGADTFNIQGTLQGSTTEVIGSSFSDTFNIGSSGNSLLHIKGTLTLDAQGNSSTPTTTLSCQNQAGTLSASNTLAVGDVVNFDDQGDSFGHTYTLTSSTLDRTGLPQTSPAITYLNFETVVLNTALAGSTVNVTSTGADVNTTINGSVNSTPTGDTINVASTGADSNVVLNAGTGNTTFNVQSTGTGSFTNIVGGAGSDSINVSSAAGTGNPGNTAGISGTLCIDAGAGNDNRLFIDDTTGAATPDVVVNSDTIVGLTSQPIFYKATGGHYLDPTSTILDGIVVDGSTSGADTFNIQTTLAGSSTDILGGQYNDVFNIGTTGNSLGGILGTLTVNGQGNSQTPVNSVSAQNQSESLSASASLPVGDTVNFNDQGDITAAGFTYTLTSSTLARSGLPQAINYANAETVVLNTALAASTVNVTSTAASVDTSVNGSINSTPTGDTITVAATGASSIVNVNGGTGASTLNLQTTGTNSFTNITGHGASDSINVSSTAGTPTGGSIGGINGTLNIDAGAGADNRLFFDNTAGTATTDVVFNSDTIVGLAPANIFYRATGGSFLDPASTFADGILVHGSSSGGNTFNIQSTLAGSTTEIDGDGANDTFNVSSGAGSTPPANAGGSLANAGGSLANILGTLTLFGGSGSGNRLIVSDYGNTTAAKTNVIQTVASVDGSVFEQIQNFTGSGTGAPINYGAVGNFNDVSQGDGILLIGSHTLGTTFTFRTTLGGSTIEAEGGLANDAFNVGAPLTGLTGNPGDNGDLDRIQGLLTVVGNGGSDALEVDDHGATGAFNYIVTPTSISNDPSTEPTVPTPTTPPARTFAGILYDNTGTAAADTITGMRLDGTDQVNIFSVTPSQIATYGINGNLPAPGVPIPGGADYLKLNTTTLANGTGGRTLHIGSVGTGTWTFTDGSKNVNFQSIERFNHVVATDTISYAGDSATVTVQDAETGRVEYSEVVPIAVGSTISAAFGDMNFDGLPDLIVAPGAGNDSNVTIYSGTPGANGNYAGTLLTTIPVYSTAFKGGVNIAVGDVNGDGAEDLIFAPASALHNPQIAVYNGLDLLTTQALMGSSFSALGPGYVGGVSLGAGDLGLTGYDDIVAGGCTTGNPTINVFDGMTDNLIKTFNGLPTTFKGGENVAVGDYNGDGVPDIIVGAAAGIFGPYINVFDGSTLFTQSTPSVITTLLAGSVTYRGGVDVQTVAANGGNPGFIEHDFIVGTQAGGQAFYFNYQAPAPASGPAVTSVSPATGLSTGGTSVVIQGSGFTAGSTVTFGGVPASSVTVNSAFQITATAPTHATGTVDVIVTAAGMPSATSTADQFTFQLLDTWTGAVDDNWDTPGNWSAGVVPTSAYSVVIDKPGGSVNLTAQDDVYVASLTLTAGTITGAGTLNVAGQLTWTGGAMSGTGTANVGSLLMNSAATMALSGWTLTNTGTGVWQNGALVETGGAQFINQGTFATQGTGLSWSADSTSGIDNSGTWTFSAGSPVSVTGSGTLTQSGTLIVNVNQTVPNYSQTAGTLTDNAVLTVTGNVTVTGGTMTGNPLDIPRSFLASSSIALNSAQSYSVTVSNGTLAALQNQFALADPSGNGTYLFNTRGAEEKYLFSTNGSNPAGGGYFIIMPNGNLYAWDGSIAASIAGGTVGLAGIPVYANPGLLAGALTGPAFPGNIGLVSVVNSAGTLTVSDSSTGGSSFLGTALIAATANGITYNFEVNFSDPAPAFTVPTNQTVALPGSTQTGALALNSTGGNPLTYTAQVGGYSQLFNIEQQYDLMSPGPNYWADANGEYLVSGNGSNPAGAGYFILIPNGNLYAWAGSLAASETTGHFIGSLGAAVFADPTQLINAMPAYNATIYSTQQTLALQATPGYMYDADGSEEKYLISSNGSNPAGGGYYVLMPGGGLYASDGKSLATTLESAPVAQLGDIYYQNPAYLINAATPGPISGVNANVSGSSVNVTDSGFVGTVTVYVTGSDGAMSSTPTFLVTFVDPNPPTLGISASSTTVDHNATATATLSPSAGLTYQSPKLGGFSPLLAIEQQYDLMETPGVTNYFLNARGAQEEYLVSGNGSNPTGAGYYVLFPNGNMFAFIGDSANDLLSTEAGTAITLGKAVYNDPTELTSATPAYNPSVFATETTFDFEGPSGPDFFYDARGGQEKYLISGNNGNPAGAGYYILMPNGNIYAFVDGSLTMSLANAPVATVPFTYYQNPNFLINPASPGVLQLVSQTPSSIQTADIDVSISGNTLSVSDPGGYLGSVTVYVTASDGVLTTTQSFNVTFTDANPPTLVVNPTSVTEPHGTAAMATLTPSAGANYTGVQIAGYNTLFALQQQLDLQAPPGASDYFFSTRGSQEKYLVSGNGSNPAGGGYYVLFANGNLFAYAPDPANDLLGTEGGSPTSVGTAVYNDPTQLTNAAPPYTPSAYSAEQSLDLQAPAGAANYYYNARNDQEKYLVSGNSNAANGGYYVLMPNGNLYAWTGNSLSASLAGAPVAELPTAFYLNPSYLINAAAPGVLQVVTQSSTSVQTTDITASISGNILTVNDTGGYVGTVLVYVTISDGAMTTTKPFQVTFV